MNRFQRMNRVQKHIEYFIKHKLHDSSPNCDKSTGKLLSCISSRIGNLNRAFSRIYYEDFTHYRDFLYYNRHNLFITSGCDVCVDRLQSFLDRLSQIEKDPVLFEKVLLGIEQEDEWLRYSGLEEEEEYE